MSDSGAGLVSRLMYDVGRIQVLTTDTNYRTIALAWINGVARDIQSRHPDWVWLEKSATFDTVADQVSYDIPADMDSSGRKYFSIREQSSPIKLKYIDQKRLDEIAPKPTDRTGKPTHYTLYGDVIRLYPTPDDEYTMHERYLKNPSTLTDSTASSNEIPAKFDEVILDGARVRAFMFEPEWGSAREQKAIYEQGILRMWRDNNISLDDDQVSERHGLDYIREPYRFNNVGMGT